MQGAGRDQCNIVETNKKEPCLTKTIKIPYSFKISVVTHATIRNHREMAHKKRMRLSCSRLS